MLLIVFIIIRPWLLNEISKTTYEQPGSKQIWLSVMISTPLWIFKKYVVYFSSAYIFLAFNPLRLLSRFLVMISLLFVRFFFLSVYDFKKLLLSQKRPIPIYSRGKAYIPVQAGQSVQPISRKREGTHQIFFYEMVKGRPLNYPSSQYGGRA